MRGLRPRREHGHTVNRAGAALAIVLVLIALFGVLCQTLTVLAAIQHRQAFQHSDQAQAHRLAEAGLLRANAALKRDAQWGGETWKPDLSSLGSAAVRVSVTKDASKTRLRAEAEFTTAAGRIHKSNQTLDVFPASARKVSETNAP